MAALEYFFTEQIEHLGTHSTKYNLGHGSKSVTTAILSVTREVRTSGAKNCFNSERVKTRHFDCENTNKGSGKSEYTLQAAQNACPDDQGKKDSCAVYIHLLDRLSTACLPAFVASLPGCCNFDGLC